MDDTRTTVGLGEQVVCTVTNLSVNWSVSGGGSVSPPSGRSTVFTAPQHPATCTVTASIGNTSQPFPSFAVVKPDSITPVSCSNNPYGTANTNGTLIGARTTYSTFISPTNVSFGSALIRESPDPASMNITWPNRTNSTITFTRQTQWAGLPCGNPVTDMVTTGEVPRSYLFNGTNSVDFSYSVTWYEQYQDDSGNAQDCFPITVKVSYKSNGQCQITYQGMAGSLQGPY